MGSGMDRRSNDEIRLAQLADLESKLAKVEAERDEALRIIRVTYANYHDVEHEEAKALFERVWGKA